MSKALISAVLAAVIAAGGAPALAQPATASATATAPLAMAAQVDAAVREELAKTGVPAASIAIVRGGRLVYAKAYGRSHLNPDVAATPEQAFAIGSVSKQFTAAAILLLAEEGKLSLNDPVGRYVPGLTEGDRITIRQILSHTAGYRDYWPQDYVPAFMLKPTTPQAIIDRWAKIPLDFQPGDDWQYSNTGYVIAGQIVQKVAGEPLYDFLQQRIFTPLGMTSVRRIDLHDLPPGDAHGYTRNALGPARPAPKEGANWLSAMAELAMTPSDLAKWDQAMIEQKVLKPSSWRLMETSIRLNNGRDSGYGLGVFAGSDGSMRYIQHTGEVSGFLADNRVWPDNGQAVIVLVNSDYGDPSAIAARISKLLPLTSKPSEAQTAEARAFFEGLQAGRVDRARLTEDNDAYFDPTAVGDFKTSLSALGPITAFTPVSLRLRGGFDQEVYLVTLAKGTVRIVARATSDSRYEQFQVYPA